eukprot:m.530772 g.530772  ORF g.530772 m.530772 type:complete len:182 (-) comp22027_c1_seq27:1649-2194(-)
MGTGTACHHRIFCVWCHTCGRVYVHVVCVHVVVSVRVVPVRNRAQPWCARQAAWMSAMLHDGYRIGANQRFSSASLLGGLPVQWTLGAVLYFTDNSTAYPEVLATLSPEASDDESTASVDGDASESAMQATEHPVREFFAFFFGFLALGVCVGFAALKVHGVITAPRPRAPNRRPRTDSIA